MHSPQKIPVLIAVGDFASGVTSWALRLRDAFAGHDRYVVRLLNCADTRNRIASFDLHATTASRAREVLAACGSAVVVPNFVWDLFPLCADLNAKGQHLHCVGFCRADSDTEYYAPLQWYRPLVSQFASVSPACTATLARHLNIDSADVHTLPTGVRVPDVLRRHYQTAPIRLAYGGRIVQEQKRVLDFVPLVEALYARRVNFQFDIAGSGRQLDELKAAMKPVDTESRVRFVPRMKPDAMPAFWASHDVFVQVSDYEGTSNSMLEAMAQGTVPAVTETASGVSGIVEHDTSGVLVPVGDMTALADAIARLARDEKRLALMGAAAHGAVLPYAMDHYIAKFTRLLDATLAAPPGVWPEGRPCVPPQPFPGIRLRQDEPGTPAVKGRIAIMFPSPLRGGAEEYTLAIAEGAVKAGYDVQGAFSGATALKSLVRDYFRAGAFHNTLEICDVGPKSAQAPAYKRFTRTFRILRRLRPRVVLFQLCGMQYGMVSLFACAVLHVPVVLVFQLVRNDRRFSRPRQWLYRWMRRRGQHYVAVSQANRVLLARAFGMPENEIKTIPNGVRLARFSCTQESRAAARQELREALGLPPEAVICITVGRLSPQKGHDILVPAIPHIVARCPRAHFIWAGEGPMQKRLKIMLETYGVLDHVTFLGRRGDIPHLLLASDLFVHPARFEGQPFSLLEAMAAGLPVVSTSASGIGEVVAHGEHGLLCRPDDIGSLRDAVLETLSDPDGRTGRAAAARARVDSFSEAAMIRQTLDALEEAADPR